MLKGLSEFVEYWVAVYWHIRDDKPVIEPMPFFKGLLAS